MIILNYLLAISLVILSVVKTADLFIKSDQALTKIQIQFENQTKQKLKAELQSDKGNISLTAAVLTSILALLLLFYVSKMKIEYKEALYRKDSYLCFQYLNIQTEKYIKEISIFNWSLSTAYAAQASGVATAQAIEVFNALTIARNIRHFFYLKNLANNKYCHFPESLSYLKNTPFQTQSNMALVTNIDETTIVRQNKWSYIYYKKPSGIRLKKSFCLKSEFQIQNAFLPITKILSQEIPILGLSNLKCFSGASS
ncbi:MAG: hypothetical protein Q7U04_15575 [Bacteriovorax sp.]|nr:hypothetical protein [Bacteriovorax sp.]